MVRLTDPLVVAGAREIFAADLKHALPVDKLTWPRSRTFWDKLRERWAYFLLARLDPYLAQRQLRHLST
jgi:phosphatidylserine/phosphatidylglycerophosphate/cardiolipin synthase-like enzyme